MVPQTLALKEKLKSSSREDGFSLPEIMVALLVFGVLVAIAVPVFLSQQNAISSTGLQTDLATASTVIENERQANNGVYPAYMPNEIANTVGWSDFVYTYSDTQLAYCLEGTKDNETLYVGSETGGDVTTEECSQANVGGAQPADDEGGSNVPPTNNNPSITAITPATQYNRDAGALITITGSHFLTGATVLFDGVPVPATVSNSGSLTFVNPGNDAYEAVTVQVKNPNARTSSVGSFEFINPILTHTAATPQAFVISNLTATSAKVTVTAIACPYNATPQYAFMMTRQNESYNNVAPGFAWTSSTGNDVTQWSNSNTFTWSTTNQGWRLAGQVQARCELEGQYSIVSQWSPSTTWTQPIARPASPAVAPATTNSQPVINTSYTISWTAYPSACPATTTAYYTLYENSVANVSLTTTLSKVFTAPGTAQTKTYTYAITCVSPYTSSPIGDPSPSRSVQIIAKPATPAAAVGLGESSIGPTQTTVYWNAVSCNIGTASYRVWTDQGYATPSWITATSFTASNPSGITITWKVEAKCTYNGLDSDVSTSAGRTYTATVAAPTGSWSYLANNGVTLVDSNDWTCSGGATPQYQLVYTRNNGTIGTIATYGWTSVSEGNVSNYQGSYNGAKMQVRCYANGNVSSVLDSPETFWTRGISTPSRPASMSRSGSTIYWSAVSCPAGTNVIYYAWITRQNNSGTTANSGETGATSWKRPSLTVGGYIYWHVQARCYSSYTTSGWSSAKDLNEPATSS